MKKLFIFVVLSIFVCSVFADLMVPTTKNAVNYNHERTIRVNEDNSREVPEWEFVIDPQSLISNYYDYQPGSYNSIPIRLQPDAMGGIYITFHARETAASTRRVYFTYIDASGNVTNVATIGTADLHEGYSGIDIDPETGDPMVAWHVDADPNTTDLEVVFTYDLYHLGSPGLWKSPFVIVDDDLPTPNAPLDEFIWPYVFIGPSPTVGKRRVYVTSNNSNAVGDPSENQLIAYADFDVNDLNAQSELDWTYVTIPLMDDWHMSIPEWRRPNCGMAVSDDGKIAIFGYVITGTGSTEPDMMFCFYNDNYGEGDFTYFEGQAEFFVDNPQNQDGTYAFEVEGQPQVIYFEPYLCNHSNVIFTDGGTKLMFTGNMNMMIDPDSWYPDLPMMYPKVYTYDITNDEFSFYELGIRGADPADDQVMLPWDLDEDGVVDNFDPDGDVMWEDGWPIYHYANDVAFHENSMKMTQNEENGWLLSIWSEGLKSRYGNGGVPGGLPVPGYEDWAEFPEICVAISTNGGDTWEDEILMNAKADDDNYAPELDGMIPCYLYVGDKIEDLGDNWGLVHLFFLDDNSYGSSIQAYGENIGGTMIYAAIKIKFEAASADPTVTPSIISLSQNYPNPFNPTTNIAYNMQVPGNATLEVYNIKGQKVKTLVDEYKNAGNHIITWNGNNNSNQSVASGIYFYKMKVDGKLSGTKKMILMK